MIQAALKHQRQFRLDDDRAVSFARLLSVSCPVTSVPLLPFFHSLSAPPSSVYLSFFFFKARCSGCDEFCCRHICDSFSHTALSLFICQSILFCPTSANRIRPNRLTALRSHYLSIPRSVPETREVLAHPGLLKVEAEEPEVVQTATVTQHRRL